VGRSLQFVPTEMSYTFLISPTGTVYTLPMSTFVLYGLNLVHFFVMRHFTISWVEIFFSAVGPKKVCLHYLRNINFAITYSNRQLYLLRLFQTEFL
jgi:peptidase E